jgi:hypothetical protein
LPLSGAEENGKTGFCNKALLQPNFSWVFVHGNAQNLIAHLLVSKSSLYLNQKQNWGCLIVLETSNFSNGHRILRSSGKSWEISWKTPYTKYFRWCKFRLLTNLCQVKTFVYCVNSVPNFSKINVKYLSQQKPYPKTQKS